MSANLIIPVHDGLPLDEARITVSGDTHHLPISDIQLKFPYLNILMSYNLLFVTIKMHNVDTNGSNCGLCD